MRIATPVCGLVRNDSGERYNAQSHCRTNSRGGQGENSPLRGEGLAASVSVFLGAVLIFWGIVCAKWRY